MFSRSNLLMGDPFTRLMGDVSPNKSLSLNGRYLPTPDKNLLMGDIDISFPPLRILAGARARVLKCENLPLRIKFSPVSNAEMLTAFGR